MAEIEIEEEIRNPEEGIVQLIMGVVALIVSVTIAPSIMILDSILMTPPKLRRIPLALRSRKKQVLTLLKPPKKLIAHSQYYPIVNQWAKVRLSYHTSYHGMKIMGCRKYHEG